MSVFVYRWLPRTIYPNIKWFLYDIYKGILNVIEWLPIIWKDRHYDWAYLAEIMEYKFRKMAESCEICGYIGNKKDIQNLKICAELLYRLREETYHSFRDPEGVRMFMPSFKQEEQIGQYYQEYLGQLLGKHLRKWWN